MQHRWLWLLIGIQALVWGGCSHDHRVNIDPEIFVRSSDQGLGKTVRVRVIDTRSQRAIYRKEAGPRLALAGSVNTVNIFPATNLSDPLEAKIQDGLERLGFRAVGRNTKANRELRVDVAYLKMRYNFEKPGIKVPGVQANIRTLLKVIARNQENTYKKKYKSSLEKSHRVLSGKFKNEQFINNGLTVALQKMLEDPALVDFLAR